MRRRQRGFTLVEGMVSLAILAIITLAMGTKPLAAPACG
ncbi:MAG: prepilin-type N-terminal cleavage/methylation domain-containing protein [Chloroflexi bacterium]|nr:MAG: prepilin-type N-terminal cleavage/methylation domain-containing protein [Chloroflexota bacterium]